MELWQVKEAEQALGVPRRGCAMIDDAQRYR
jgi:hypothetical protein